jgi:hypothetical protein
MESKLPTWKIYSRLSKIVNSSVDEMPFKRVRLQELSCSDKDVRLFRRYAMSAAE